MGLTASQYIELSIALLGGICLFAAVFKLPERTTIAIILIMIPVQLVDSRFGTSNMVVTYLIAFAYLLQGRLKLAPLLIPIALLLFSYALSFTMSPPPARIHHVFYLIAFFSNILIFYLIYNYVSRNGDWRFVMNVLFVTNAVVILACVLELVAGNSQLKLFGLQEWGISANRASAGRLVGPFGSTHTTADYLVTQTILLAYCLVFPIRNNWKLFLALLVVCNCMILVATGDRGGFVGLIVGVLAFLFLYRSEIGRIRALRLLIAGSALFVLASLAIVNFTEFGVLYDRLEETDIESGLTDSRSRGFRNGMAYFEQSPILGLGPQLAVSSKNRTVANIPYRPYPHILIMYVLATLGLVGFIAWSIFFVALGVKLLETINRKNPDIMLTKLPKLCLLILGLFLAGELRIEFLRSSFLDYQHYMFALFGWFVAISDQLKKTSRESPIENNIR